MKNKRFLHLFIAFFVSMGLSLGYVYGSDIYKGLMYKGEFIEYTINKQPTLYVFYSQDNPTNEEFLKKVVANVGEAFGDKVSIEVVSKEEPRVELYKDLFRLDSYPTFVAINKRGYMVAFYDETFNYKELMNTLSLLASK